MTLLRWLNDHRWNWQQKTQEEIKKRLLYLPENLAMQSQGQKLVVVYGKPQIGKTTMILTLLGVDERMQAKLDVILRAGIPQGNSSTSTAIFYVPSDDNLFGICERSYNSMIHSSPEKCDEEQIQKRLQTIREKVESGQANPDTIIYLYIPQYYFDDQIKYGNSFSVLDVPGEGSRNIKEHEHTYALLRQYMMVACLNILVRELNDINDLRDLVLPDGHRIEYSCDRYIVVTTRSYSQESIRNYFSQPPPNRRTGFGEYLDTILAREFKRIFPGQSPSYYAVDIGQSYQKLMQTTLTRPEDRLEIQNYRTAVFDAIRRHIQSRQGDGLGGWISYVRREIRIAEEEELGAIDTKLCELQKQKEAKITEIKIKRSRAEKILKYYEAREGFLADRIKTFAPLDHEDLTEMAKRECESISLSPQNPSNTHLYSEKFEEIILKTISPVKPFLKKDECADCAKRLEAFCHDLQTELVCKRLDQRFLAPSVQKKQAVATSAVLKYVEQWEIEWNDFLQARQKKLIEKRDANGVICSKIAKRKEHRIAMLQKELQAIQSTWQQVEQDKNRAQRNLEQDQVCLESFKQVACEFFGSEKKEILYKIHHSSSPDIAVRYAMLLGIISKDFERMMLS